jgi:hypothetical protein
MTLADELPEELHQFLRALRDAFSRLGDFRYQLFLENEGNGFEFGQTANWGGSAQDETVRILFGVWGRRTDGSSIIWGIDVTSTPAEYSITASVEREGEEETIELWRHVSRYRDPEGAQAAIIRAVDLLLREKDRLMVH